MPTKRVSDTNAIRVYAYKDRGELWWLIHAPKRVAKKGPFYAYPDWKLLKVLTELSAVVAKPKKHP